MNEHSTAYAALLLRVGLGVMYIAHGALKIFVFTLPGTAAFFADAGFPAWLAYPVAAAEVVGGLALVLGVGVRAIAIALTPVLFGALLVHFGNGWLFTNANGGWEYVAFLILVSAAVALLGPGAWALHVPAARVHARESGAH